MFNIRRAICKLLRKGSWFYGVCDCQRYEPGPQNIVETVVESIRVDDSAEDNIIPPVIKKCDIPYHETGKLLINSGFVLTDFSMKDGEYWKEADYPKYLDALVEDGVNAVRAFTWFEDNTPEWDSFKPGADGQAYWDALARRLGWIEERDLTAIITMIPYRGDMTSGDVRSMVRHLIPFLPNVIIETENEPVTNDRQEMVLSVLKETGWPINHIQLGFVDSGAFGDTVLANPGILSCCHYVATTDTIFSSEKYGWANSPGTMKLMSLGMYGSNDGEDSAKACRGPYFYGMDPKSRRPATPQLEDTTRWMLQNGKGYEDLDSAAFSVTAVPNLIDGILNGQPNRRAMRKAYNDATQE